jgi:hypothetical protein
MGRHMPGYHTGYSFLFLNFIPAFINACSIHPAYFSIFFWLYILVSLLWSILARLNFHFEHWSAMNASFWKQTDKNNKLLLSECWSWGCSDSIVSDERLDDRVRSQQRQRIFPLASLSRPALWPTQPLIQWVPGVVSPEKKRNRAWRWPLTSV